MKKISITFIIVTLLLSIILTRCQRELTNVKSLEMSTELASLYEQMPDVSYKDVESIYNGEILRFESEDAYMNVYETLLERYEGWIQLFLSYYNGCTEEQLELLADSLEFDDNTPLREFENILDFHNNLRNVCENRTKRWASDGLYTIPPIDSIINCPIEQTLFSIYHEICIADTIFQLREDHSILQIPIYELKNLSHIRTLSNIDSLLEIYPSIKIYKGSNSGCYYNYWFRQSSRMDPNNSNKMFSWSFLYRKAIFGHKYKTKITMTNYKLAKGKWKKNLIRSGVESYTKQYKYVYSDSSCTYYTGDYIWMGLVYSKKSWSKSKKTLPVNYIDDTSFSINGWYPYKIELEEIRIDPSESYFRCNYNDIIFTYNLMTLEETIENPN